MGEKSEVGVQVMPQGFEALHINQEWVTMLEERGIKEPTEVQAEAIPAVLAGKDLLAQSQTGTGKTLAYLLPVLQKLDPLSKHLQAVILVPTRELGMQIMLEIEKLTPGTGLLAQVLIGGASIARQTEKLRQHPQLVVGTPGRIVELLKVRKLTMHYVKTVVVDEVDQVFELGSSQEVDMILKGALRDRQILFFSATIPDAVRQTADRWMHEPHLIAVNPGQRTAESLEHMYLTCDNREKIDTLRRYIRMANPKAAIVFVNETDSISEALAKLKYIGMSIEAIYGELDKQERARVMKGFREGRFQLLLATDVAARGLDIEGLTHVVNLEPPLDADHYIHRAGRTGRMGRSGTVVSIVTPKELFIMDKFSKQLGVTIEPKAMYEGKLIDPKTGKGAERGGRQRTEGAKPGKQEAVSTPAGEKPVRERHTERAQSGQGAASGPKAAGRTGPKSEGRKASLKPAAGTKVKSERERKREGKNKGAPKWLKEKRSGDQ
jgi:ATP-dependent RNA helicase DeaD